MSNSSTSTSFSSSSDHVVVEVRGNAGLITLNRPQALNALSLPMVRSITAALRAWKLDPAIACVAIRGMGKNPTHAPTTPNVAASNSMPYAPFGSFCAGGDIRFFHQAALAGNPELEDFFTEEYALNHLIQTYPKPYIAFMDGIVMGGGMGLCQGASHRIVTERTKMAMPETGIGLFPDVGGGYFLSRCPGNVGEYLALTGNPIGGADAVHARLADCLVPSAALSAIWHGLGQMLGSAQDTKLNTNKLIANYAIDTPANSLNTLMINLVFSADSVAHVLTALDKVVSQHTEKNPPADSAASLAVLPKTVQWAMETAQTLRKRSPLMLHVALALVRRARRMPLADELRLERDIVRHCFYTAHLQRFGATSETAEGIRALAVDKDHAPKWNPARIEDITDAMVEPFFYSPWPPHAHPLASLV